MLMACCTQRRVLEMLGQLLQASELAYNSSFADFALLFCIVCASAFSTRCGMPAGGERLPDAVRWRDEDDAQQQPTGCGVQLPHALLARSDDSSILCLKQIVEYKNFAGHAVYIGEK